MLLLYFKLIAHLVHCYIGYHIFFSFVYFLQLAATMETLGRAATELQIKKLTHVGNHPVISTVFFFSPMQIHIFVSLNGSTWLRE